MSVEETSRLLAEWQKRLRLQDWNIEVYFKQAYDMDRLTVGTCHIHGKCKAAQIWLMRPEENNPENFPAYDIETTLVHELLHIHFWPFEPEDWDSPAGVAQEQVVSQLSNTLVNLKREGGNANV